MAKPTRKQVERAMDVLERAQPRQVSNPRTNQFTPIIPTSLGILLELLSRKFGVGERSPQREFATDLLLELPVGGPGLSDEAVQLVEALFAAEASDDRGSAFLNVAGKELQSRTKAAPKKKDSPQLKAHKKNLSKAFKESNAKLRKKNGQLKKGKTQVDVAKLAQRLAKKMKKPVRGTRKGQVRKTARRAFER